METEFTNEQILAQQTQINAEEEAKQPFISQLLPLTSLQTEFDSASSQFQIKIQNLQKEYKNMRRIRRDGSCFYRAFTFSLLEKLLIEKNKEECQRLIEVFRETMKQLGNLNYDLFFIEEFCETVIDQLNEIMNDKLTIDCLIERFCDYSTTNSIVTFMRLVTSTSLQIDADQYLPFIYDAVSVHEFCKFEVEPTFREADHLQIQALTKFTSISIKVEYLDQSNSEKCSTNIFGEQKPQFTLLYRPGHYDIIY
eukprot:TRINITY_DN4640_c3_g1_i1.p1 TRINITY_DN4640_c3_g1~~TRINITY_DN4640_c3_g1_i1.p1  ORF type:complete len:260 (-),score=114.82 TRINITY_DN4640_c3_g1_i1:86-844(-)